MKEIKEEFTDYLKPWIGENGKRYFNVVIPATFTEDDLNSGSWYTLRTSLLKNIADAYYFAIDEIEEKYRVGLIDERSKK